jgi:hypothetical protein
MALRCFKATIRRLNASRRCANLARLLEQGGVAGAVTLINVVVFRGPSEATDRSMWAHELTHVDQYRDWGVHSFAVQYARNWHSVENPAYAKGNGYEAWAANTGNGIPNQQPAGLPSGFGMSACGCWGPNPPATAQEPRMAGIAAAIAKPRARCFRGMAVSPLFAPIFKSNAQNRCADADTRSPAIE